MYMLYPYHATEAFENPLKDIVMQLYLDQGETKKQKRSYALGQP
jgi:hypothetical protein